MRGRRHKLQVSTFPFLAVLLCAMGSLILILLVMDRKAHRAALARAQQRAAKLADESARNDAERIHMREQARAEHEQKREEVHAKLSDEQMEMQLQMRNLRNQLQEIAARLHYEQDTSTELRRKVQEKRGQLQADERLLLALRTTAQQTENQSQESNQTLHRMTVDLLRMEQALKDLKASQKREQKTFSVVPYHGRRGENRRPIYVECFADGVVFHPEHKAMSLRSMLPGARDTSSEVRAEVQRRIAIQRAKLAKLPGNEEQTPYLLLLVRPAGVHTYYYFQAALRGLDLQFGYEFIDDDWVLDFPVDDEMPSTQPWMIATKTPARSTPAVAVPPLVKANPPPAGRIPSGAPLSGFTGANGGIPKQEPPRLSFSPSAGGTGTATGGNGSPAPPGVAFSGSANGSTGGTAQGFRGNALGGGGTGGSGGSTGGSGGSTGGSGGNGFASTGGSGQDAPLFPNGLAGSGTGSAFSTSAGGSGGGIRRSSAMPHPSFADASEDGGYSGPRTSGGGGSIRGLGHVIPGGAGSGSGFGAPGTSVGPAGDGGGGSAAGSGPGGSGTGGGAGFPGAAPGGAYAQGGAPLGGMGYGNGGNGTGAAGNGGSGGRIGGTGYGNAGNGARGMGYGNAGNGTGTPGSGALGSGNGTDTLANGTAGNGNGTGTPGQGTLGGGNGTGAGGNGTSSGGGAASNGMAASGSASSGAANDGRTVIASAGSEGYGSPSGNSASGGVANGAPSGGANPAGSGQAGGSAEFGDNLPAQGNGGTVSNGGRSSDRVIYLDPATGRPIKPPPSAPPTDEQPSAEQTPPQEAAGNRGPPRVHVVVGNGGQGGEPADPQSQAMNRFAPTPSVAPPRHRPVVTKPGWVHGGRDWTIYLECREEGVVLYPMERMFSLAEATREPSSNSLIKTIQQMIDRRQSARHPDEPPYHPSLCLLVRPEHIRTYLSVSSALQALPIPKTRRNLDDDDDLIGIVTGSVP